jgi:hypothetical protein
VADTCGGAERVQQDPAREAPDSEGRKVKQLATSSKSAVSDCRNTLPSLFVHQSGERIAFTSCAFQKTGGAGHRQPEQHALLPVGSENRLCGSGNPQTQTVKAIE